MSKLTISPESLEVANKYLETGSVTETASKLHIPVQNVTNMLGKAEVKRYIDAVYLDTGYRNRNKIASLMDEIIEAKLEEARESEIYSSKDLADLIALAHKMKMEELKLENTKIANQTNVQINELGFGQGNYGALMSKLLGKDIIDADISEEK
jgi:hypothetical protein